MSISITILGGGNIGTLLAAELSTKANVTVYSSRPDEWANTIGVFNSDDELIFHGSTISVTHDINCALKTAQYIFITLPSFMFEDVAKQIEGLVTGNQTIFIVPGSGGAEFAFKKLIDKGVTLVGFQRVHCIARIKEYGRSVYALGRKKQIELASIPSHVSRDMCKVIGDLLSMPCVSLNNYLCLTLTPSNPILHTSRLFSLFWNNAQIKGFSRNPLFYEEWDDKSSEILIKMDEELQVLCNAIPLDLREVVPLTAYYESFTAQSMTKKIRSIQAFKGLRSPVTKDNDGFFKPDFSSRYFISDFDFGLKIICDIANIFNVDVPTMRMVLNWYFETTDYNRKTFNQVIERESFINLYIQ